MDIGSVRNGVLCSMHPSEGYWIFKGAQNRAQGSNMYGNTWQPPILAQRRRRKWVSGVDPSPLNSSHQTTTTSMAGVTISNCTVPPPGIPTAVIKVHHKNSNLAWAAAAAATMSSSDRMFLSSSSSQCVSDVNMNTNTVHNIHNQNNPNHTQSHTSTASTSVSSCSSSVVGSQTLSQAIRRTKYTRQSILSDPNSALIKEHNNYMIKTLKYALVCTQDSPSIVRMNVVDKSIRSSDGMTILAPDEAKVEKDQLYQFFDESYLSKLSQSVGWPRDKGVVELIPIVVGLGSV